MSKMMYIGGIIKCMIRETPNKMCHTNRETLPVEGLHPLRICRISNTNTLFASEILGEHIVRSIQEAIGRERGQRMIDV